MPTPTQRTKPVGKPRDPQGNRAAILAAALEEFSARGYEGGRVNTIAASSGCDKQLIYYYFGSKEGVYVATLEKAYREIRQAQADVDLEAPTAFEALMALALASFDFVAENPQISRLIAGENTQGAEHLRKSAVARDINHPVLEKIERLLAAGVARGEFRDGVDPVTVHYLTSSLTNHFVTHAATFGHLFGLELRAQSARDSYREFMGQVVGGYVLAPAALVSYRATHPLQGLPRSE